MADVITIGLSEIMVGTASPEGTMPADGELKKIGKTYKDSCKFSQDTSDVTEHYEEGHATPEVRKKTKKAPTLTFSLMTPDVQTLVDYVGGENIGDSQNPKWGFDGTEVVANKAIKVVTQQGLDFEMPNCDIEATINGDFSATGIFLVDFTVTPLSVATGKALRATPKK